HSPSPALTTPRSSNLSPQTDKYSNDPYLSATRVNRGIVMGAENINIRTKPDVKSNKAFVLKKNTSINFIKEVKGTSFEGSNIWRSEEHTSELQSRFEL